MTFQEGFRLVHEGNDPTGIDVPPDLTLTIYVTEHAEVDASEGNAPLGISDGALLKIVADDDSTVGQSTVRALGLLGQYEFYHDSTVRANNQPVPILNYLRAYSSKSEFVGAPNNIIPNNDVVAPATETSVQAVLEGLKSRAMDQIWSSSQRLNDLQTLALVQTAGSLSPNPAKNGFNFGTKFLIAPNGGVVQINGLKRIRFAWDGGGGGAAVTVTVFNAITGLPVPGTSAVVLVPPGKSISFSQYVVPIALIPGVPYFATAQQIAVPGPYFATALDTENPCGPYPLGAAQKITSPAAVDVVYMGTWESAAAVPNQIPFVRSDLFVGVDPLFEYYIQGAGA
jgi:hypothetical protein